ncbi:astacin [Ostertagia ostertagi]
MIAKLLLLALLFDGSIGLTEKGRIALTKMIKGESLSAPQDGASIEEANRVEGVDEKQLSALENEIENPIRAKRQIYEFATRWANNKVYYYFDATITEVNRAYVRTVLKYLQARTCINFIEDATATNRIRVFNGGGCYSSIGMIGGEQDLSLGGYCMVVGTVAHEFTHALGSLHMHSRKDRDTYIKVDMTNVKVSS